MPPGRKRIRRDRDGGEAVVRINPPGTAWFRADPATGGGVRHDGILALAYATARPSTCGDIGTAAAGNRK